jgi:hypothetical protein
MIIEYIGITRIDRKEPGGVFGEGTTHRKADPVVRRLFSLEVTTVRRAARLNGKRFAQHVYLGSPRLIPRRFTQPVATGNPHPIVGDSHVKHPIQWVILRMKKTDPERVLRAILDELSQEIL